MDLENSKEMWNKFTSICIKIGQKVIYSIFQEFFNYLKTNKPKRYNKLVMQPFTEVRYFCKRFWIAMTLNQDFWNIIAIVMALNTPYNNLNIMTASLLESGDKIIDQIKSIL